MKKWLTIMLVTLLVGCVSYTKTSTAVLGEDYNRLEKDSDYMLYVNAEPSFVDGVSYQYLVDVPSDSLENKKSEIDIGVIVGNYKNDELVQISSDGGKALFMSYDSEKKSLTYQVSDISHGKTIRSIEVSNNIAGEYPNFSPKLDTYIIEKGDQLLLVDAKGSEKKLHIADRVSVQNIKWAPDNKRIAFMSDKEGEKSIAIYDFETDKIINRINIGKGHALLTQWSETGKLLYNYEFSAYMVDTNGENKVELGKYVFYPMLSPNGRYLVYSHPGTFQYIDSLFEVDEYRKQYEQGLFVKDLKDNKDIKLPSKFYEKIALDQIPILWINKVSSIDYSSSNLASIGKWVLDFPIRLSSSSYLQDKEKDYSAGFAMDGNTNTAWVEGAKGNGVDEWIRIDFIDIQNDWEEIEISRGISAISLSNGYSKSKDAYYSNNRVKRIKIEFSDGTSLIKELEDNVLAPQKIDFGKTVSTKYLKIIVMDIYKGEKYNDACISEIRILPND